MKENEREALALLGTYTAGRFDLWALSGNAKASCRAHIMSVLTGTKVPQSKSGINALRAGFYSFAKPEGECSASQESNFIKWARELTICKE